MENNRVLTVRLPDELMEQLQAQAVAEDRTVGQVVRAALRAAAVPAKRTRRAR